MSRSVWRIAADTPGYGADDVSGEGARRTGGRWNRAGIPLLYTSETRALACLETLVHLKSGGLPLNRYLVRMGIPDIVWADAEEQTSATLAVGWEAEPAGIVSMNFGSDWIASGRSCLLVVPSVIVPEERNILVNPRHPDHGLITATKERRWLYDPRLAA